MIFPCSHNHKTQKKYWYKLEAGHSTECITYSSHSIAFNMFLHFVTLWPWPIDLTVVIGYPYGPYGKFGDYSFSHLVLSCAQTDRQTDMHTDADDRYTHATPVSVSK